MANSTGTRDFLTVILYFLMVYQVILSLLTGFQGQIRLLVCPDQVGSILDNLTFAINL